MNFRYLNKAALCVVLACTLLTGCTSAASQAESEAQVNEEEVLKPTVGGIMTIAMHSPETLNPILNRDDTVDKALRLVFEPLFVMDENMQAVPNMAESCTALSSGKAVNVKLKEGLKWQDDTPITADDIIYTLDALNSAEADAVYKSCTQDIASYAKVDNLTVQINYKQGTGAAAAAYSLCFPIIPRHYYRGSSTADMSPMGSGLYKFTDYTIVNEMNLSAWSGCFKGSAYISQVCVKIMPDSETQLQALSAGVIDCAVMDIDELGSLDNELSKNASLYNSNRFEYIGLNTRRKIFADVNVRQAIAHMVPTDSIVSDIYINKLTKSITPINPNFPYNDTTGMESYDTDSNMANALILASGLTKSDFTFTILVNQENSTRVEVARSISKAFNENGLNTSVEAVPYTQYKQRLQNGSFDMYIAGVKIKENMDITPLIGSTGALNYGGYASGTTDSLISACKAAADSDSLKRAVNELNKAVSTELPIIGIGFEQEALVTGGRIKGDRLPTLNNVYGNINNWFIG